LDDGVVWAPTGEAAGQVEQTEAKAKTARPDQRSAGMIANIKRPSGFGLPTVTGFAK